MGKWLSFTLVAVLGLGAALYARPGEEIPREMTGMWAGYPAVLGDSIELTRISLMLSIAPDGRVDGTVGGATLRGAHLERTHHLFDRLFKFGHDWKISGDLDGDVVPCSGPPVSRVIMSLDWERDHYEGSFIAATPKIRGHREILASSGLVRLDRVP
jgi:hypothetical protein